MFACFVRIGRMNLFDCKFDACFVVNFNGFFRALITSQVNDYCQRRNGKLVVTIQYTAPKYVMTRTFAFFFFFKNIFLYINFLNICFHKFSNQ